MTRNTAGQPIPHIDGPKTFKTAFAVSCETIEKLECYAELLAKWQKIQNLVAPSTLPDIWHRHFADSAQLTKFAPGAEKWLDLGSGAGFPGLVIAILLSEKDSPNVHLVESSARKCAFLGEVARQTGISVEIHNHRIETQRNCANLGESAIITARALAPLDELLGFANQFFCADTKALFLKGRDAELEVRVAEQNWSFCSRTIPSLTGPEGRIIEITNLGKG